MSTVGLTNQIRYNLDAFFNRLMIKDGYFYPVEVGELAVEGDMSELSGQTDLSDYNDYEVWQSAYKPWVFEENITAPSGSLAITYPSGVYVDSVYTDVGVHFDYNGGRVIFDTALAGTETVQVAGMTYKNIYVGFPDEQMYLLDQTEFKSQGGVGDLVSYPSDLQVQPPALYIEWMRTPDKPWQLGGGKRFEPKFFLHVFSEDIFQLSDIVDMIVSLEHSGIKLANWNTLPQRFDVYGDKSTGFKDYLTLQSSYTYKKLYFSKIVPKNVNDTGILKRAVIELDMEVIIP